MVKHGLAFGIFKCSDPRPPKQVLARLREALQNIKDASEETKVPQDINFTVLQLGGAVQRLWLAAETELVAKAEALEKEGANFIIRAGLPGATNQQAADELGFAFNCLYGGTELFDAENEKRSKLVAEIFYKDDGGKYVSKMEIDGGWHQ
ncbi:MAG: hypothetical protein AB1324_03230 [Candidatus Micrarchaeota archaeon]